MKKQKFIKKCIEKLEKKLNETTNVYAICEHIKCEFCPFDDDGCSGIGCIDTIYSNIDNINEVIPNDNLRID